MADELDVEEWSEVQGQPAPKDKAEPGVVPKRRKAENLVAWVADLAAAYTAALYPGQEARFSFVVGVTIFIPQVNARIEANGSHPTLAGALVALRANLLEKANTLYAEMQKKLASQNKAVIELAARLQTLKETAEERKP
jgi:hypothetical protein